MEDSWPVPRSTPVSLTNCLASNAGCDRTAEEADAECSQPCDTGRSRGLDPCRNSARVTSRAA
jgi:hypothetical protein